MVTSKVVTKNKQQATKVDTIEKLAVLMADGFGELNGRMDNIEGRMDKMEGHMDKMEGRMDRMEEDIRCIRHDLADITRRIKRLEEQGASHAGFAKEIDYLMEHVAMIERHIGIKSN